MNKTKIEWATAVWNPVTGCTKVSEGCRNCYAEGIANRFWGERKFTDIRCHEDRLNQPETWKKGQRIFVNSMSDLFHPDVPYDFIVDVFAVMNANRQHTFIVLTKRPDRYYQLVRGALMPIPNVWIGVSVENQKAADERIPILLQAQAAVRFVSCEPLLGRVDLVKCFEPTDWDWSELNDADDEREPEEFVEECEAECDWINYGHNLVENPEYRDYLEHRKRRAKVVAMGNALDWVICGGESGPGARPMHPDWARSLRDQCQTAGVPFFFKQKGEWQLTSEREYMELEGNEKLISMDIPGAIGYQKAWFRRVGKKNAGRVLDGRTWDEYPQEVEG